MKPYAPTTSKGRTVGGDDIHHKSADQPKRAAIAAAKRMRHSARQSGRLAISSELAQVAAPSAHGGLLHAARM